MNLKLSQTNRSEPIPEIEIEINGCKQVGYSGQMIISVADAAEIYIPRFCYHKKLSIAANCRMCLVEVNISKKPVPACATPISAGMQIFTDSSITLSAQRAVMEFLLINHPLDCPICDQGGECELQDLAMGFGDVHSCYSFAKRAVVDDHLGPLISTEMTRCIQCTRCIRFCEEIAGLRELGAVYRGEKMQISTYVPHAMQSEISGNIIDLCPVGALTARPSRFRARAWELQQVPGISVHDCLGTNTYVHVQDRQVMRVVARENEVINSTWLADRDRFSYTALTHPQRLGNPLIRVGEEWVAVEWKEAILLTMNRLCEAVTKGGEVLGALISPNSTVEEFYLLQNLVRKLGSPNIDHRLREIDTTDQSYRAAFPGLGIPFVELVQQEIILLVGSNIRQEQPLIAMWLRQAALNGAKILIMNSEDYDLNFTLFAKCIVSPRALIESLIAVIQALRVHLNQNRINSSLNKMAQRTTHARGVNEIQQQTEVIAGALLQAKKITLIAGAIVMHHPQAAILRYLLEEIGGLVCGQVGYLTDGANSAGGWLAGAVPHRGLGNQPAKQKGLNAYEMLSNPRQAYLLVNVEPEYDCANAMLAQAAMASADCIIALSTYHNPILERYASIILPMASFAETTGTYINAAGECQSVEAAIPPYQLSRPGWDILSELCESYLIRACPELGDASIRDIQSIQSALKNKLQNSLLQKQSHTSLPEAYFCKRLAAFVKQESKEATTLIRLGEIPVYALDPILRRAQPLQEAQKTLCGELATVRLHPETAGQLNLETGQLACIQQGSDEIVLPVIVDSRVAIDVAAIPGAFSATIGLGDLIGPVMIRAAAI